MQSIRGRKMSFGNNEQARDCDLGEAGGLGVRLDLIGSDGYAMPIKRNESIHIRRQSQK